MQNRILTLLVCLLVPLFHAWSEEEVSTYHLDSVEVYGEQIRKQTDFTGATTYHADSLLISNKKEMSIADFIAQHTPYVVKQNGNGMMTTLSLRGTSASHTQAIWEDINITPLTMGQTDYSTLPVFFFEEIEIHPGGESSVFGNGAIGGAVTLGSDTRFTPKRSISLSQEIGSFGKSFTGADFAFGNAKVQNRTKLFFNRCENDFKVHFREETFRQKNASFRNYGALHESAVKINNKHTLAGKLWFTRYERDIQPMMQNNFDASKYDHIEDQSAKVILSHEYSGKWLNWRSKAAWLNDRERFREDLIATHDLMVLSNVRKGFRKATVEIGGELHYIKPEVYAYKAGVEEWRGSIFALSKATPHPRITLLGNIRQTFATGMKIPFSPSFGVETNAVTTKHVTWMVGGNIARNTKIPTLNDRYWGTYSNTLYTNHELTPETAFNLEAKSRWEINIDGYKGTLSATLYRNDVDNWIMWMPRGTIWKPTNIEEVLARGVEAEMTHAFPIGKCKQKLQFAYNHSFTEIRKGFADMHPFLGHQMPLTPQNSFSGVWTMQYKSSDLSLSGNYTGERTSSDIYDVLAGYFLMDLSMNHTLSFPKKKVRRYGQRLTLSFHIKNLLNKEYQNLPYRGMPGINFLAGAKWQIASK